MSKLVTALEAELKRLVKAEVNQQLSALKAEIADLKRRPAGGARGGPRAAGPKARTAAQAKLTPKSIRTFRKKLGLSQKDLANMTGVTPVAVYFWESGRTTPGGRSVEALEIVRKMSARQARKRADSLG
jgi:DNA-binding transcriptional regulator YiaG